MNTPHKKQRATKVYGGRRASIRLMPDGTARYCYYIADQTGAPGAQFQCSLFSEIGEGYKVFFTELLRSEGLSIGPAVELPGAPWLADTLNTTATN